MNQKYKNIFKSIFSVTNIKRNNYIGKQILFCGFKIKFKDKYKSFLQQININQHRLLIQRDIDNAIAIQNFKSMKSALNVKDKSKYKGSFLLFKYNYLWANCPVLNVNLGDYIQTIASKHVINSIYKNITFQFWDRDNLSNYVGKPIFTLMQGWFSHSNNYLPNDKILPIFIGTHITTSKREQFTKFVTSNYEYFKGINFGCRDTSTLNFMKEIGLKSYLSRCLTLTLPKRKPKPSQNKVYIVNIPEDMLEYIPTNIRKDAVYINQRSIDVNKDFSYYINSEEKYLTQAKELLQEYCDKASLVITSALHCASPCIAMGIPTVLIDIEENNDRFGSLDGIFNIYNKKDLISDNIDYNPPSVDIEELKHLMIKNVELSINQAFDEPVDSNELYLIREKIENYKK